jgi:GNAT superfamily N-acetyltransferase
MFRIERYTPLQVHDDLEELVRLLQDCVADGAAVGFMPPLLAGAAQGYWRNVAEELARGTRVLLVAHRDGLLVGSAQLELAARPNGLHRAEVQKLLVHTGARRRGVGSALLAALEQQARAAGRSLLVLDTRAGDAGEQLYLRHGYTMAGSIPNYARSANGELHATIIFYKELE